ncbi:MAG: hypothetical protein ACFFDT_08405 [Candidatus Hodarchaeota archaeon]
MSSIKNYIFLIIGIILVLSGVVLVLFNWWTSEGSSFDNYDTNYNTNCPHRILSDPHNSSSLEVNLRYNKRSITFLIPTDFTITFVLRIQGILDLEDNQDKFTSVRLGIYAFKHNNNHPHRILNETIDKQKVTFDNDNEDLNAVSAFCMYQLFPGDLGAAFFTIRARDFSVDYFKFQMENELEQQVELLLWDWRVKYDVLPVTIGIILIGTILVLFPVYSKSLVKKLLSKKD